MFITFEGGEGSGKSTIINRLYDELIELGFKVIKTREPGGNGSPIAEQIRGVILDKNNTNMDHMTEAMLYAASRRQHLVEVILPALNEGNVVICDRYIDSSFVYQGVSRGLGVKKVRELNEFGMERHYPDLTLLIDVDPKIGLERTRKRSKIDRLDLESLNFHEKVRAGYLDLADGNPRFKVVDGNQSLEDTYNDVKALILKAITKIKVNPDKDHVKVIRDGLKRTGGYCPCIIEQNKDTKCLCKQFREMDLGMCHCGLYIKERIN